MKSLLYPLLFLFVFACSKKEDVAPNAKQCYKDSYFSTIKGFYCLTQAEVDNFKTMRLRGQTTLNLSKATEADYSAAPDKVSDCNTCR